MNCQVQQRNNYSERSIRSGCAGAAGCLLLLAATLPASAAPPAGGATCATCHRRQAEQFAASIHATAGFDCRQCHGGRKRYDLKPDAARAVRTPTISRPSGAASSPARVPFNHGPDFLGKPSRRELPELCGGCHSDVAKMNPYGLPTDQLAQYRISGHGRGLYEKNNDRVAVCTDCHGTHIVLRPNNPASTVNPKNVPATCGRCHSDPATMRGSQLSTRVVQEYRQSVHGVGLLERGDTAMPHCATCHGSHSAVPPGFRAVGHVCGRCHQQEEKHFLESPHAKFPRFPRCIGCHAATIDKRDHRIRPIVASPGALTSAYEEMTESLGAQPVDEQELPEMLTARREPPVEHFEMICQRCHHSSAHPGHRVFLADLDREVSGIGAEMYTLVRQAEYRYASTASRVGRVGRGVLLVADEAMLLEQMRTQLVGLGPAQHTLDLPGLRKSVGDLQSLADRINHSLDDKERALHWRYWALIPMWGFLAIFVPALWIKYKRLKRAWVAPLPESQ